MYLFRISVYGKKMPIINGKNVNFSICSKYVIQHISGMWNKYDFYKATTNLEENEDILLLMVAAANRVMEQEVASRDRKKFRL